MRFAYPPYKTHGWNHSFSNRIASAIGPGHAPGFHASEGGNPSDLESHPGPFADLGRFLDMGISPPFSDQENSQDKYRKYEQNHQLLAPILLFHGGLATCSN